MFRQAINIFLLKSSEKSYYFDEKELVHRVVCGVDMTAMSLELEMDAINIVWLTRARVETVSKEKAKVAIDVVSIGATIDMILIEEEMGVTSNVVLTRA